MIGFFALTDDVWYLFLLARSRVGTIDNDLYKCLPQWGQSKLYLLGGSNT